jgi:hypothetical protein
MFWKILVRTSGVTSWMASLMFAFKASMVRGLFGPMRVHLEGQKFQTDDELESGGMLLASVICQHDGNSAKEYLENE